MITLFIFYDGFCRKGHYVPPDRCPSPPKWYGVPRHTAYVVSRPLFMKPPFPNDCFLLFKNEVLLIISIVQQHLHVLHLLALLKVWVIVHLHNPHV